MTHLRASLARIAPAMVLVLLSGCGGGDGDTPSGPGGTGGGSKPADTIVVDGSSTVVRISEAAQRAFKSVKPDVNVTVDEHGTGGGFARYLENDVDIVDASRPAKPDEEKKAREQGIEWTRFTVGYDGITLVVNSRNTFVKELSVDQLKAMWAPGSKVKTWKDVDAAWPAREIVFYSPDNDSGTFEFFTEAIVGKAKSQRDGVQQNSSDNSLVQGVAGDDDAIGYFGYAYYLANKDKLNAVAVKNGKDAKAVLPSVQTINDKTYAPLSRPLFIYVKNSAARQRPEVADFVRFYLEDIDKFAEEGGYNKPTAEDKKANAEALKGLLGAAPGPAATGKKEAATGKHEAADKK